MKKFLTVLLALSVVFTYTVGTAFAAAAPTSKVDAKVTAEQKAVEKMAEDYAGRIGYDSKGHVTNIPGATDLQFDNHLTKVALDAGIAAFVDKYKKEIKAAGADAITDGLDETAANNAIAYWRVFFAYNDETYLDVRFAQILFANECYTAMYEKAVADASTAFTAKLDAVDPSLYSDEDAKLIKNAIADAKEAIKDLPDNRGGLNAIYTAESIFDGVLEGKMTTAEIQAKLDEYKAEKKEAVEALADAFKTKMTEELDKIIDGNDASKVSVAILKKNTLDKDVANVLAGFIAKIDVLVIDAEDTTANTLNKVEGKINRVVTDATTAFTYVDTNATAFYAEVAKVATKEILVDYAKTVAENMKNEYDVTTGLARYNESTVDEYLAEIVAKINAGTIDTYTLINTEFKKVPTADKEIQDLKDAKADGVTAITKNLYDSAKWDGDRKDAVEAIQDEYVAKIKAAKSPKEVEDLVKEAQKAMDAYLTTKAANDYKTEILKYMVGLGYVDNTIANGSLGGYAKVVADKNPDQFSLATQADAVKAAADVLFEAVLAKNNVNLKGSEINTILKANYNNALAVIDTMKTNDQLTTAEKEINDAIDTLPLVATLDNKEQYLAVQKMIENYDAMIGSNKTAKIDKLATFENYMKRIVKLEREAVEKMIKDLPKVITVADKAAVDAAVAAEKAYADAYGDYNANGDYKYGYVAITNYNDLFGKNGAVERLSNAMMVEAAKKIAAIPATVTVADKAAVEAARAAYDALNSEEKELFSEALLAKLVAAENALTELEIKAVESMKVVKAHSAAGKGYIKVMWEVVGNETAIDGFQVYKSTKAQSGYTFMGKTTKHYMTNKKGLKKGKRFYYKVRAYKVIDGVKYFSDWSNKANRIYK